MFEYKKNLAIKEYVTKKGIKKYMFQIYVGINPNTHKKSVTTRRGFKTPALANAEYRKIEAQVKNDKYRFKENQVSSTTTFKEVYLQWFSDSYRNTVQSSTIYKTKQLFDMHVLPEIGNMRIGDITSDFLQPLVNDWVTRYAKFNIISRYTNRVFKYAYALKWIDSNPFDHIVWPKRQVKTHMEKGATNFFDTTELKKFTDYILNNYKPDNTGKIDITHAACLITLAYTGIRRGELLALTWSDIDFDNQKLDINKTLVHNEQGHLDTQPPKWLSYRTIDINNLVIKILGEYREYLFKVFGATGLVFPNTKGKWRTLGKPNEWLESVIKQGTDDYNAIYNMTHDDYYKRFVHRITPHGLRHTHATWLFERDSTITPKSVQQRLGHRKIGVTLDIYTHVTSDQNDKLKSALDIDLKG